MFSHRDPSIRKSGTANIFIKNLDKTIDNKALHDTFSAFGGILSCKVAVDGSGQSKGYGFVQFEQEESALTAIEKVNGMLLNDKQVFVGPFVRRQERDQSGGVSKFNNVYVKNLGENTTEDDLKNVFGAYGTISSAVVMRDSDGKSKCFGFVNFEHPDNAAKAVEALNGKKRDEKEWYVGRAQKKSEREAELRAKFEQERKERIEKYQGVNLYLKNLDDTVDDEKLRELFADYGTITSCKVMRDPQGQSRGSGFVAFSSPEEATRAVTEMNGKMVGSKPLYVALAQRKEERRARLQAAFAQMRTSVSPAVPTSLPMYHPGPGMSPQMPYYGQHPSGPIPLQPAAFGYQPQIIRPGGAQFPNYIGYANVPLRQGQQGQRAGGRRGGAPQQQQQQLQQQMIQRGGNRNLRYTPNARNMPDTAVPPQGIMGAMVPVPLEIGGLPVANVDSGVPQQPLPISALASALASAPPEQQRAMLGEQLYPLVDQLEHDYAGKVTGMLLEMDQTEVLHLIESPEALRAKVAEAMDVLRMAQAAPVAPTDELGNLSISNAA
nr:polyadenylate-binding protein 2-like isoform X2 [Physcomitrium patens]|eukprot:XP_024391622.1 polyadenylate-binding protein 2-like isoform X2 [Physcomitrella patens]